MRVVRVTPESHQRRSEARKNRCLPAKRCAVASCGEWFAPEVGNQLRCETCIAGDPNNWQARKHRPGNRLKGWNHETV